LAEQHSRTLSTWGGKAGVRVGLLHSGLKAEARRQVVAAAAEGQIDVLVGTHALLQDTLAVPRLALATVDEQHRFGVRQRAALRRAGGWIPDKKAGMVPHLLVLSATPIPRSLALTAYGDLDLVTLDRSPPGRQPVTTHLALGDEGEAAALAALKATVADGGQGFVVCPAIEEEKRGTSVLTRFRHLKSHLAPARVGLLHGKMASDQQRDVISAFSAGRLDVLVATTVLEVGVDVPAASIMVIEDAERFGLAQLHQLRGRVGRAGQAAHCYLLTRSDDAEAIERLRFVAETRDGFRIAEEDLRRRGPGEVYGERQTGLGALWQRDPAGLANLVEQARREAEAVLADDPALNRPEHAALRQAVETCWERRRPIAEEAG
jgi:ATP-dependent DNA helicase RecG